MLLSDKYTIYGDFEVGDHLCEYFDCKNIVFNYMITKDDGIPIIDKIPNLNDKNKKILLLVSLPTIKKLCEQVSKYNNFLKLVDNGRIKLIYYQPMDSLVLLGGTDNPLEGSGVFDILKKLKFTWLLGDLLDEDIKRQFNNVEFYELHRSLLGIWNMHHFSNLMNKEIEKKNTFFSLMRLHPDNPTRQHRYILFQKMQGKAYLKDAIIKVKEYDSLKPDLKDLESEYGKIFLDQATWKDGIPVISYYENTYFELVAEQHGGVDGDETIELGEKTIKPIAMGHPFMVLSSKHFLKNLRELGFKTFGDFIDESYDECHKASDRVDIISKNLERLDMTESKKFYNDTRSICEYNQNHLMYLYGRYKFDLWKNLDELFKKYQ